MYMAHDHILATSVITTYFRILEYMLWVNGCTPTYTIDHPNILTTRALCVLPFGYLDIFGVVFSFS